MKSVLLIIVRGSNYPDGAPHKRVNGTEVVELSLEQEFNLEILAFFQIAAVPYTGGSIGSTRHDAVGRVVQISPIEQGAERDGGAVEGKVLYDRINLGISPPVKVRATVYGT